MKRFFFLTVALALFLGCSLTQAQPPDTLWTRTYGGSLDDWCYFGQQTSDEGYILVGMTTSFGGGGFDYYLVKTDANGDTLWTRVYGGSGNDKGYYVQQTSDGGYIVAGYTNSFGAGNYDIWLIKTDASGDSLWSRTYGGSGSDICKYAQQTPDGGYVVAGGTDSFGAGSKDFWLLKTDADGDTLWTRTYGGTDYEDFYAAHCTSDGGYIVTGWSSSFGVNTDAWVVRTDANGDSLWARTYGGDGWDAFYSVQETSDGGYVMGGQSNSFPGPGDYDFWVVKTDADGNSLWSNIYGGDRAEYCRSVDETFDGGYALIGYTQSFGAGSWDLWLVKTDADGDSLWSRTFGGVGSDCCLAGHQTTDGGYILAAYTGSFGAGGTDAWLVRVASEQPVPDVTVEIIPDDPPVTVPQGGRFGFTGILTNNTEDPEITDAWTMAIGPEKEVYGPFKEFSDVELEPYETRTAHFYQRAPNLAPLGFYDYIAYCGDYPSTAIDSSFFQIEVVAGTSGGREDLGWLLSGSFDRGDDFTSVPSYFALLGNYPNPFNASTVISYELPVTGTVTLEVYNLLGEKVATLADGEQEPGCRSVSWDASAVSSGLYFYKLTAGDFSETKRMMLVK
jgi:hypothetical protein